MFFLTRGDAAAGDMARLGAQHLCSAAELKFRKVSLPLHSRLQVHKELWKGRLIDEKKHIQNYLLTNDAENVMNKYPFLDLLL